MKKIRLVQKFGGNTALESVSFVGWVGGGWYPFFRLHSGSEVSIYPSYARETSLRSEKSWTFEWTIHKFEIESSIYTARNTMGGILDM